MVLPAAPLGRDVTHTHTDAQGQGQAPPLAPFIPGVPALLDAGVCGVVGGG